MLIDRKRKRTRRYVIAALLCATAITLVVTTQTLARPEEGFSAGIVFVNEPGQPSQNLTVARSIERFIKGMANRDAQTVWMFASEEEQDAFGTEAETYAAYADTFPAFIKTKEVTFTRFWREDDTPFVQLLLSDGSSASIATMGLWLDDAGDWKLVSCDIKPVSHLLAGR